jgi:hypothetical protein
MEEIKNKLLTILKRNEEAIKELTDDNYASKQYIINANNTMLNEYFRLYTEYKDREAKWNEKKNIPV